MKEKKNMSVNFFTFKILWIRRFIYYTRTKRKTIFKFEILWIGWFIKKKIQKKNTIENIFRNTIENLNSIYFVV